MLKLIIVDDEPLIRESLATIVDWNTIGYKLVGTFQNGIDALDYINDEYPDVVITDLKMPILDGLELIERTHKLDSHIEFIILSGYGEFAYAKRAMKFGVRHYLVKPTQKEQILEALCEIKRAFNKKENEIIMQKKAAIGESTFLLQCSFFTELLNHPNNIKTTLKKYQFLNSSTSSYTVLICSFLNDAYRDSFIHSIDNWVTELGIKLEYPIIYLHCVAILIFSGEPNLYIQKLCTYIKNIKFIEQEISPTIEMNIFTNLSSLCEKLIPRIIRFANIFLCHPNGQIFNVSDNIYLEVKLNMLVSGIQQSSSDKQVSKILDDAFKTVKSRPFAIAFSSSLFLKICELTTHNNIQTSKYLLEDFISCNKIEDIKNKLKHHISLLLFEDTSPQNNIQTSINLLKKYVMEHLDSENLSLKYIAENYLYVSIGYLSKQFLKLEGTKFSNYLNTQRMEKAKSILASAPNSSIQSVAEQVGFGNNPRYFSQVFKKYTQMTPSDYISAQVINR